MKISVAMAYYNGGTYIEEQMDSILSQLGEKDEVIVSVDGASDGSKPLLLKMAEVDSRIHIVKGPGKGVVRNFENAIRHCNGDIIYLSDQDDIWLPNKIQEMVKFLQDFDYDLVTNNCTLTDSQLNIIQKEYYTKQSPVDRSVWGNFYKDLWLGCCMAFHRRILNRILPFPEKVVAHDIWIALFSQLHYRCGYYPKVLQLYRRHDATVSAAGGKSQNSLLFKLQYRFYILIHLILRSIKTS